MSVSSKILKKKMEFFEKNNIYPKYVILDIYNYTALIEELDSSDDYEEDVEYGDLSYFEGMVVAVTQLEKDEINVV